MQEYKCPCCGGAIEFNSEIQKMKCPYCDTEFEMETLKDYDEQLKSEENEQENETHWDTQAGSDWQNGEEDSMKSYICNSCGGEILCTGETAATSCPFCGNPVVLTENVSGMLRPDYVIPFKLDKEAAKQAYQNFLNGKIMFPKSFKAENHIDEIKGVYVPFWLFDADVSADIRYSAKKIKRWSDSNYRYKRTKFYSLTRCGDMRFENVPVDGSSKIDNEMMESIEPFDFNDAVDFQTAYLAGYFADKYDVSAQDSVSRANERIRKSTEDAVSETVEGYDSVSCESTNIKIDNGKAKYALYPVWLLSSTWRDKKFTFVMNGQTGKFVGNLPLDKKAAVRWFFGIFGGVTAGVYIVSCLLNIMGLIG